MRQRSAIAGLLTLGVLCISLARSGTSAGCLEWTTEVSLYLSDAFACAVSSTVDLRWMTGPVLWASSSEFRTGVGYLWQEGGMRWAEGPIEITGGVLFGPSTIEFLYAQAAAVLHTDVVAIGVSWTALGDAVLGGPGAGFAVRVAGHFAGWEAAATTEFAARLADEEFHGIDIVHGATGLFRHYTTAPVTSRCGITGETLSVCGFGYGRVREVCGSAHLGGHGLDVLAVGMRGIDAGVRGTSWDLCIRYDVAAGKLSGVSRVTLWDELVTLEAYLTSPFGEIGGIHFGAVALSAATEAVTLRGLVVLDPWRYAIAAEAFGEAIQAIDQAAEQGHEVYAQYRALLSVGIRGSPRGRMGAVIAEAYLSESETGGVRWAMSRVRAVVSVSTVIELTGELTVASDGSAGMGLTLTLVVPVRSSAE